MRADGRRSERGSVLMLMPVAVLVVFLLGAIAIDAAASFEAQRQAVADAQAVANDAASALSQATLRSSERDPALTSLDPAEVERRVDADVAERRLRGTVRWWVDDGAVHVAVERTAPQLLSPLAGHGRRQHRVVGQASARLAER